MRGHMISMQQDVHNIYGTSYPQERAEDRASPRSDPIDPNVKSAVVVFPGIDRERDMARTLRLVSGREPSMVWHAETESSYLLSGPNGAGLFWIDEGPLDGGSGAIFFFDGTHLKPPPLFGALPDPSGLAIADPFIYWGEQTTGNLMRGGLDGSPGESIVTSPDGQVFFMSIRTDRDHIYWMTRSSRLSGRTNLMKMAKCGGPAIVLQKNLTNVTGLVYDDTYLYVSESTRILRVEK